MKCCKSEPTTSDKVKAKAATVVEIANAKADQVKQIAQEEIAPMVAEKASDARDAIIEQTSSAREAAAPHFEAASSKAADLRDAALENTASQREAAADALSQAKEAAAAKVAAAAAAAEEARKEAAKKAEEAKKEADKKASKAQKKADKQTSQLEKKAKKTKKKAESKSGKLNVKSQKSLTDAFGSSTSQDVIYKAAALRGQAQQFAEEKNISTDAARDKFNDDVLPQLRDMLAAAAAAGTAATQQAVSKLPADAQKQVVQYVPQAKPAKKKGGFLLFLGLGAVGGAGYLYYADQQKKQASNRQLSETAIADSAPARTDEVTINNPVTNYARAEDTTMVRPAQPTATAEPAGGPGTAATWTDAEQTGHMETRGLEDPNAPAPGTVGETRSSRRAAREDNTDQH